MFRYILVSPFPDEPDASIQVCEGRPLSIFPRDFDTQFPREDESEEHEEWRPLVSVSRDHPDRPPVAARIMSCFNASALLGRNVYLPPPDF